MERKELEKKTIKEIYQIMKDTTGRAGFGIPKAQLIEILCGKEESVTIEAPSASVVTSVDTSEVLAPYNGILSFIIEGNNPGAGGGFIRSVEAMTDRDIDNVYISNKQIYKFGLKIGDEIFGMTKVYNEPGRNPAILHILSVNGKPPEEIRGRTSFERLTPIYPTKMIKLETTKDNIIGRTLDIISPVGRGQRGLIVAPPMAGKTIMMKSIAKSIMNNDPEIELFVFLVDERPEEVTDWKDWVGDKGTVIASSFDVGIENHVNLAGIVLEMLKRKIEAGKHVCLLLDSLTRLARSYNNFMPSSGRTLSGGIDPLAITPAKKFIGAARNIRGGGSLTILATVLVDTGSRMDDVIYEEFKGTGNMEVRLDRSIANKKIYPAIDIQASATRNEDLIVDAEQAEAAWVMRKAFNDLNTKERGISEIVKRVRETNSNRELFKTVVASEYAKRVRKES